MRVLLRIRSIFCLLFILVTEAAFAGWGVESDFAIYTNPGFDFFLSYPRQWGNVTERKQAQDNCDNWSCFLQADIDNESTGASRVSHLRIRFFSDMRFANVEQLIQAAQTRHPEIPKEVWRRSDLQGGISYAPHISSGERAGQQPEERVIQEYYLVGVGQVVQIETSAFPDNNGNYWIELIRNSVNRLMMDGPKLEGLRWDKAEYGVGDIATLTLDVSDLPGAVRKESLGSLSLSVDKISKPIMRVGYSVFSESKKMRSGTRGRARSGAVVLRERSRFQVSFRIGTHFSADSLNIMDVSFLNEFGGGTFCSKSDNQALGCRSVRQQLYAPTLTPARVNNSTPDHLSPEVRSLQVHADVGLHLSSSDDSGIAYVRLRLNQETSVVLFPEDVASGRLFPLSSVGSWGRNIVTGITVVDVNGLKTTFKADKNKSEYECTQSKFEMSGSGEGKLVKVPCQQTFPVLTFIGGK